MDDKTIKACPFCGSSASVDSHFGREYWIQCDDMECASSDGRLYPGQNEAIAAWNRRAALPSVQVPPGYMLVGPGVVHAGGGSFDGFAKKQINAAQRLATELQTPPAAPQGDEK